MKATAFFKTKTVEADVIALSGALAVGCRRQDNKIVPALSPLNFFTRALAGPVIMAEYSGATDKFWYHDGTRSYYIGETQITVSAACAGSAPFMIDERDGGNAQLRLIGDTRCMVAVRDSNSQTVKVFNNAVRGGILKSGRLFAVDLNDGLKLKWSGEGGTSDWVQGISGAGWMYLDGKLGTALELKELNGNIVAVCEHGLTVISAYGNPENFKVVNAGIQTPPIRFRTARVDGGKLYFCAGGGVYVFDGAKVKKVKNTLEGEILTPQYAALFDGVYYYCGESKSLGRRAVAALDISDGECYLIDFPAEAVAAGGRFCMFSQMQTCFPETGGEFCFESGSLDFSTPKPKTLKRVEITADGQVDAEVWCDGHKRSFYNVKQRITVNMRGVNFKIILRGRQKIDAVRAFGEVKYGV